jgi:biopolymer transport protein ExbD
MSDPSPPGPDDGRYAGWPAAVVAADAQARELRGRKRRKRRALPKIATISITSLTDIITVLLVYLLKTFGTNPIEIKDSSLEVPRSICNPAPGSGMRERQAGVLPRDGCGEVTETTVVMLTGPRMKRVVRGQEVFVDNVPRIAVNADPVLDLDPATYRVPDEYKDPNSGGWVIAPLRDALQIARKQHEIMSLREREPKPFDGKVVILADRATPYRVLSEVLITCGEAGFADFRFAVIKPD